MVATPTYMTAEQLLHSPELGRCELVQGELIRMSPAGFEHGRLVMCVSLPLASHVQAHRLGVVIGAETGFLLARDPDTVRAPDVGFVRSERIPPGPLRGFFPGAPDLAVEVLSPDDRASDVFAKVQDWLDAGARAVWVVDGPRETIAVYRAGGRMETLRPGDVLAGGDAVPGFSIAVAAVFAPPPRPGEGH